MDFAAHVSIGRARMRMGVGHAAVADRRQNHGEHADQESGGDVFMGDLGDDAEGGQGRGRLDDDDAVKGRSQRVRTRRRRGVSRVSTAVLMVSVGGRG